MIIVHITLHVYYSLSGQVLCRKDFNLIVYTV
ncbi:Uncharacterised protein [Segatella copri]|nr:Uncharacterised protein [Segatella copri]